MGPYFLLREVSYLSLSTTGLKSYLKNLIQNGTGARSRGHPCLGDVIFIARQHTDADARY